MVISGQAAAGVTVPDTKLARDATELVRESATDLIYHHSRRVVWFGSLPGRNCGRSFDPELLYIGAMFHDPGLNQEVRGNGRRFDGGRGGARAGGGAAGRGGVLTAGADGLAPLSGAEGSFVSRGGLSRGHRPGPAGEPSGEQGELEGTCVVAASYGRTREEVPAGF